VGFVHNKLPCPIDGCNSSDGYHIDEDGKGYCFSCDRSTFPDSGTLRGKDMVVKIPASIEHIKDYPSTAMPERGISLEVATKYGVKCEASESTGLPEKYFFPYYKDGKITGYKVCHVKKKEVKNKVTGEITLKKVMYSVGDTQNAELFGSHAVREKGQMIIITEGEIDTLSAYQMMKESGKNYNVVSLPMGANVKAIRENKEFLEGFDSIMLNFDMDEKGQDAAKDTISILSVGKVKNMTLPVKDANELLLSSHRNIEYLQAVNAAKSIRPESILTVQDAFDEAITLPEYGRKWPWPSLDKLTYGRRGGEGIYVGAGVKVGKTEFLSQMVDHIIFKENRPVFLAKFEQSAGMTLKAIAGKHNNVNYSNPDNVNVKFTQEDLSNSITELDNKVFMFNAGFSSAGEGNLWERIKGVLHYMVVDKGVKDIFIDPITQLTDGMSSSDTETYLRAFSNEIQALSQELGFFYYIFCHLKSPSQGTPHEEGGRVKSAQFRGSRAMQEKTKFMLGIERNILADDETDRNTSRFVLLLNSGFGKGGAFDVVYNPETTEYLEPVNQF